MNRGLDYLVPREDGRILAGSTLEDAGFDASTVPEEIDRTVARLKLEGLGVRIDELTEEQRKYLRSWGEGTV